MSEENSKDPSSDTKNARGPRVISFGEAPTKSVHPQEVQKPRVFSFNDTTSEPQKEGQKPRILTFNETPTLPVPQVLEKKPRTIVFSEKGPASQKPKREPHVFRYLPGAQARKRIEVSMEQLRAVESTIQNDDILKASQELIRTFNLEDGQDKKFLSWGQSCQQEYASTVQSIFEKLHGDTTLDEFAKIRLELADELSKLSLDNLKKKSGLTSWFSSASSEEIRQKLEIGYQNIHPIIKKAKALLPRLLEWKKDVEDADKKIKSIIVDTGTYVVAGAYLIQYVESKSNEIDKGLIYQIPILKEKIIALRSQLTIMLHDTLYLGLRDQALEGYMVVEQTLGVDIPRWQLLTLTQIAQPNSDRSAIEEISSRIRNALNSTNK